MVDADLAVRHLAERDTALAGVIEQVGPFSLKVRREPVFAGLMRSIVYQQLSGKAAKTIHGRLVAKLPKKVADQPTVLLEFSDDDFRAAGVSRPKMAAIRDLATRQAAGGIPDRRRLSRMEDEEIIEQLTAVRGIGRWTVEMLLIFWLGRPDVLPVNDLGVRRGFAVMSRRVELPVPQELAEVGERWKPYRSVAAWYLWRAADGAAAPNW